MDRRAGPVHPAGAMPEDVAIEITGLEAGYGDRLVLRGVDARIPAGAVTCIVGGSGCGKSTLLRCIVGLLRPRRGSIRVLGQSIETLDEEGLAALRSRVGLMFQYGAMLASLTVADNLRIPLRAHTRLPGEIVDEVVRLKLAMVHLHDAGDRLPGELSGGMRKRAGLARALMLDPELLLCDEPSAGLDPLTAADLDELIVDLRRLLGITVVVVTHELASIARIADHVVMLDDGRVRFAGTLAEARTSDDPRLGAFFSRRASSLPHVGRSVLEALGATP